jgi:hypothetical protein
MAACCLWAGGIRLNSNEKNEIIRCTQKGGKQLFPILQAAEFLQLLFIAV